MVLGLKFILKLNLSHNLINFGIIPRPKIIRELVRFRRVSHGIRPVTAQKLSGISYFRTEILPISDFSNISYLN